jgi:hypothetical protein
LPRTPPSSAALAVSAAIPSGDGHPEGPRDRSAA